MMEERGGQIVCLVLFVRNGIKAYDYQRAEALYSSCLIVNLSKIDNMDSNGTSNATNTRAQPSIRSFFQPRQPSYTPPPSLPVSQSDISIPPAAALKLPPNSQPKVVPASTSTLPQQVTISLPQQHHIQPLRRINSLLLPITYPDAFYHKVLSPDPPISFSRIILWTDPTSQETKVIGGIVSRLDPALAPDSTPQAPKYLPGCYDIYVQSLALLSPYRGKGLAAEVLREVIESATTQKDVTIASLYAHVWTENEEALQWYGTRGFKREDPVLHGYYRRLKPDTAWILRRRLMPMDHLANPSPPVQPTQSAIQSQIPTTTSTPPPPAATSRPPSLPHARSFQERGPDREWNDLPEDVLGSSLLKPPSQLGSREGSTTSSRSSSRSGLDSKGKKKRVYPAAAFGS